MFGQMNQLYFSVDIYAYIDVYLITRKICAFKYKYEKKMYTCL